MSDDELKAIRARLSVTVEWPMRLKNALNGSREHWAAKAKRVKRERNATTLMLKAQRARDVSWCRRCTGCGELGYGGPACPDCDGSGCRWPIAVRLVRVYAGKARKMDDDGCVAAFKHVRDAVAAYFGVDDADPRIRFEVAQVRGPANMVRIDFAVEDDMRSRIEAAARDVDRKRDAVLAGLAT